MGRCSVQLGLLAIIVSPLGFAFAEDWPQWMGPNRNGVCTEAGLVDRIPDTGLEKVWSAPLGAGYAGPAVAKGKLFVLDRLLDKKAKLPDNPFDDKTNVTGVERIVCLNAKTGQKVWVHEYPCDYRVSYGLGPRCTPTVHGDKVYSLGTMGHFKCLNAENGEVVWQTHFVDNHSAKTPHWGFCGHPLIHGNLLIALVGAPDGLVMAFNKDTGSVVWKSLRPNKPGEIGYAPPTMVKVDNQELLLQYHPHGVSALNPLNGEHYWTVPLQPNYHMSIMAPQISGNTLFVAGYDCGVALELKAGTKPVELWRCDQRVQGLHPINMTPLIDGQTIYGVDQPGMMRAIDLRSGKRHWFSYMPVIDEEHDERFRGLNSATAFLVKNHDRFFSFNERGSLRILKLSPEGLQLLGKTTLLEPTSVGMGRKVLWSHPAFAQKCVFVRNDQCIACFSLAKTVQQNQK
jgi:outer membrane protein assembly factor BamB